MSCSILVNDSSQNYELDDIDANSLLINGRNSPCRGRSNQQSQHNILDFLALITRTIYARRLRLLKIYMATIVILFLILLIFKFSSTNQQENVQDHQIHQPHGLSLSDSDGFDIHSKHKTADNSVQYREENLIKTLPPNLLQRHDKSSNINQNNLFQRTNNHAPSFGDTGGHVAKNFSYTLNSKDFAQMRPNNVMQVRIREAAKHSWDNYRRYAWGFDMLKPRSKEPDHWFDLGLTIVDAADTLIMMGLTNEANLAIDWMEHELEFNSRNENSNCFELTIRVLAGILSAYHLTGSEKLKQQAINFGDILLHCYDTESRIVPYSDIDLSTRKAHPPSWHPSSSLSEVTSLQLEFRFLSQISGDPKYETVTFRTSQHVHNLTELRRHKLLPMYISPLTGQFEDSIITLGARSDSYYEYLLKQYLQTGIKWLENDYLDSMEEVNRYLFRHTNGVENFTYVAEMQLYTNLNDTEDVRYIDKMDHLVCFLPGTLVLGYYHFSPLASEYRLKYNLETDPNKLNSRYDNHLEMAKLLARTCFHMYKNMGTGLSPEIANFVHKSSDTNDSSVPDQPELQVQSTSAHNILRPEFVESLFYLYHITGLPMYRHQAGEIFEAFQKYSRIPSGYSAISDVRTKPESGANLDELLHRHAPDRMESFWLSETLKYLYLTFCDDKHIVGTILNSYVFNTEAHLFPIS